MPPLVHAPTDTQAVLPVFSLPTLQGGVFSSADFVPQTPKLVMFICAHCPYVKAIESRLIALGHFAKKQNWGMVGVCSNDPQAYPEDAPKALLSLYQSKGYSFAYCVDAEQKLARQIGAVCTPDFFVYAPQNAKKESVLFYRGRLDDSWQDPAKVTREELKMALQCAHDQRPLPFAPTPSMGCSIKWRKH